MPLLPSINRMKELPMKTPVLEGGSDGAVPVVGDVPEDKRRAKDGGCQRWEIYQRVREITEALREMLQNERCAGERERFRRVREV